MMLKQPLYPPYLIKVVRFLGRFARIRFVLEMLSVVFWSLTQWFRTIGGLVEIQTGNVAYLAHGGGFRFGLLAGVSLKFPCELQGRYGTDKSNEQAYIRYFL